VNRHWYAAGVILILGLGACSDNDNPTAPQSDGQDAIELVALGNADDQGVRVTLFGPQQLRAGYTPLQVRLTDASTGAAIPSAIVQLQPMMHMVRDDGSTMDHSAPTEPPTDTRAVDGVFSNPVVFIMPGAWQLHVDFSEAAGRQGRVTFPLVVEPGTSLAVLTGEDGATYFVALVAPTQPGVGRQDLEIAVFTRQTMMSFPPVPDLRLEMVPHMPSMGHGSPDNEHPIHLAGGHYVGAVNFIMTGDWSIEMTLLRGEVAIATTSFAVLVE
jgi:hypothetical protein